MHVIRSVKNLSRGEKVLWLSSLAIICISFVVAGGGSVLTLIASLVGATALIFVGKGDPIGQIFTIVFAVIYSVISLEFRYYGEMITYAGMTLPSAFVAMVTWLKNPYSAHEVKVSKMTSRKWLLLGVCSILVTASFYFILAAFNTANIVFSTISVTTSFLASMLTIFRSPYYAVAYSLNDIVLIVLWVLATIENPAYFCMVICFVIFLINDMYGFINWQSLLRKQAR